MENYYLSQKDKLLKQHRGMAKLFRTILGTRYGEAKAKTLLPQIEAAFLAALPELPYVGGDENRMTDTVVQVATPLAVYRVLRAEGEALPIIGEIVYQTAIAWVRQYPKLMRKMIGKYFLSGHSKQKLENAATESQRGQYENDFVYEIVEGEDIHWGINYHECAIVKWFAKVGAAEFAPYMCRLDWVMYEALEINLERTQTIAQGAAYCDFRFRKQ